MAKSKKTAKVERRAKPKAKAVKAAKPRSKSPEKKAKKPATAAPKSPKAKPPEKGVQREEFVDKLSKLAKDLGDGKPHTMNVGKSRVTIPIEATFKIDHEPKKDGRIELEFEIMWQKK